MRASRVAILVSLATASLAEECSVLDSEHVPSLIQAQRMDAAVDYNRAQIGVNNWAGKFDILNKVPVEPDTTNFAEVDVGTASMDLSRLGPNKLPEQMVFFDVFNGVDLRVTALDEYKSQHSNRNGKAKGYGVINLQGGTSTTFKFQFTKKGTQEPVVVNKLYFTMANIDQSGSLQQEVSMLTGFDNLFMAPQCNVHYHPRNGSSPAIFVGTAPEQTTAALLQEERANSMTWSFLAVSELRIKLATPGGSSGQSRSFYFGGQSSLTKKNCMKAAEMTALNFGEMEYNNLGGFGPSVGGPRAIRYSKVTKVDDMDVDLILKNTAGEYRPSDPARNGARNGFAMINIESGMDANFSFSFVKHGGMEPVNVQDIALTFHDIDRAPDHGPATSILGKGFKRAYLSENTQFFEMEELGGKWYSFNNRVKDDRFARKSFPPSPLRLTEEQQSRSVSMEWPQATTVSVGVQMDGGQTSWSRNLYISGVSRLSAARETPFICW